MFSVLIMNLFETFLWSRDGLESLLAPTVCPVPGRNQQVQIMVTWLRAPKGEPHTLCELWVQRHTGRSLARNGQRKLELLGTP